MFFAGAQPMAPGRPLEVLGDLLLGEGRRRHLPGPGLRHTLGRIPATKAFAAGPDWKRYTFPFTDFGLDGSDVTDIFWGGGPALGPFRLQIDGVRLEPK